jgi:hypothetical protein
LTLFANLYYCVRVKKDRYTVEDIMQRAEALYAHGLSLGLPERTNGSAYELILTNGFLDGFFRRHGAVMVTAKGESGDARLDLAVKSAQGFPWFVQSTKCPPSQLWNMCVIFVIFVF